MPVAEDWQITKMLRDALANEAGELLRRGARSQALALDDVRNSVSHETLLDLYETIRGMPDRRVAKAA